MDEPGQHTEQVGAVAELVEQALRGQLDESGKQRLVRILSHPGQIHAGLIGHRLARPSGQGASDPLVAALRRLTAARRSSASAREQLDPTLCPTHRMALAAVGSEPLGFCWLLLEEARGLGFRAAKNRGEATLHVRQAIQLTTQPDLEIFAPRIYADIQARGAAYLAEALRLDDCHYEAEASHRRATRLAKAGTAAPELAATLFEVKADLHLAQGQHSRALARLERAAEAAEGLGARRAELWIRMGAARNAGGRAASALGPLRRALDLLTAQRYPRLHLSARHNLADALLENGQPDAATRQIRAAKDLYERFGEPLLLAQRAWILGLAALHRSKFDEAESLLGEARDRLLDQGFGLDAARVLLDLGRLYVLQDQPVSLSQLCRTLGRLRHHPEVRELLLSELRGLVRLAEARGHRSSSLEQTVRNLEAQSDDEQAN